VTTRNLVVVSGGLSVPSSSRLLADRLATATQRVLADRGDDAVVETVELREHAHAITTTCSPGSRAATCGASSTRCGAPTR